MGPETRIVFLQQPNLIAAQGLEARSRDNFAVEYGRGQSILSVFNRGKKRITGVVASLTERISTLAEFNARHTARTVPAADFPRTYAHAYASEHTVLSTEAIAATVEQNVNSGWFSNFYSFYQNTGGLRLIAGAGLAAYGYFSGVDTQTAKNYYEAAVVIGGTGLIDSVRGAYLATTTRLAGAGGNVAEIKRRWGSTAEGWVTGDERNFLYVNQRPIPIDQLNGEARSSLERALEEKIISEGIVRPVDSDEVQKLRGATARVVENYDLIVPTVRARDAAKSSRAIRVALTTLLFAGAVAYHNLRPEVAQPQPDCGTVQFHDDDWIMDGTLGNPRAHSLTGYAQARLLRHVTGNSPDLNSGAGWDQLRNIYRDDEAVIAVVDGIRIALSAKNRANLKHLTSDLVKYVGPDPVADLCASEIEDIARNAPRKPAILQP